MNFNYQANQAISGQFVDLMGERFYKISNVDRMSPFFISVVSASDHWLFISSTGCLSAGRIRPENALFPYRSVDHIHENAENTGSKTIVRVKVKTVRHFGNLSTATMMGCTIQNATYTKIPLAIRSYSKSLTTR